MVVSAVEWDPVVGAFVVLRVARSHHLFKNFLLGVTTSWWVVANVVGFVSWVFFYLNVCSVQLSVLNLVSQIYVGLSTSRQFVFQEAELFFDIRLGFSVTPDVNVGDGVIAHELLKGTHRVHSCVCLSNWFEPLRTTHTDC